MGAAVRCGVAQTSSRPLVLHHHPFTRAANAVWMLEEVGVPYELSYVDIMAGAHKRPELVAQNPMGKLPILVDGETVVTESAAIGLYLADRYAYGSLAPAVDDPARASYLRWSLFAPSVVEPAAMAKYAGWSVKEGQAGWGAYDAMVASVQHALAHGGPYVLGERFTMVDCILGGTLRFMLAFKMVPPLAPLTAYAERLAARPAHQRAEAINARIREEHGLDRG
jgi:glutathione S-transferase